MVSTEPQGLQWGADNSLDTLHSRDMCGEFVRSPLRQWWEECRCRLSRLYIPHAYLLRNILLHKRKTMLSVNLKQSSFLWLVLPSASEEAHTPACHDVCTPCSGPVYTHRQEDEALMAGKSCPALLKALWFKGVLWICCQCGSSHPKETSLPSKSDRVG